ncbi:MAG: hypothetical protein JSW27_21350 [Phycisphaerales bacterium]|nr:MAG: hypothetical protein JSW27_21350 [Phycisphaerales bacterium]
MNVWPAIARTGQVEANRLLYWRAPKFSAVRSGSWKLVLWNDGSAAELYHLASDPYETRDLAAEQPQRVAQLKRQWAEIATRDR